jgi:hypothetical protein
MDGHAPCAYCTDANGRTVVARMRTGHLGCSNMVFFGTVNGFYCGNLTSFRDREAGRWMLVYLVHDHQ